LHFIDEITIDIQAGDGGDGSTAMRREKFRPLGGPAGGDGGDGGDVVFEADARLTTLLDLRHRRSLKAASGENGRGKDQYGKGGASLSVRLPVGTQVFDAENGELLTDLAEPGQRFIAAKGGRGGRGNIHFVTSTDRAPLRAERGQPGQMRRVRLELKLLADVGLVGYPNVGKSTLVSAVSRARPKVADYPFTTLVPHLGVVSRGEERAFVIADIPGLIEGAAEGAGLGHRFLKHVERTRVLLHLLSVDPGPERDPVRDFEVLRGELERFDAELAARPALVVLTKLDLPEVREALEPVRQAMHERGLPLFAISAATGEGVRELLDATEALLASHPLAGVPRKAPLPTAADRPRGHDGRTDEDLGDDAI
jgi:GTP-binding protein